MNFYDDKPYSAGEAEDRINSIIEQIFGFAHERRQSNWGRGTLKDVVEDVVDSHMSKFVKSAVGIRSAFGDLENNGELAKLIKAKAVDVAKNWFEENEKHLDFKLDERRKHDLERKIKDGVARIMQESILAFVRDWAFSTREDLVRSEVSLEEFKEKMTLMRDKVHAMMEFTSEKLWL